MRILIVSVALLAIAGCSSSGRTSKVNPPAPLAEFEPAVAVAPAWYTQIGEGGGRLHLRLIPLADSEAVYVATHKGRVEARDALTGKRLWRTSIDTTVTGGPGDGGDLVLIGGNAVVVALEKATGTERWRAKVSSEVLAAPVRGGNVVVVRTVDGRLIGLDATEGRKLWEHTQQVPLLSIRGAGDPQIAGRMAVAGFANGRVMAVDLEQGRALWQTAVAVPRGRTELERMVDVDGRIVVDGGVVYAVAYQGRLSALALSSGQLLWTRDFSSYTGLALNRSELLLTDAEGNLWALDRRSGSPLWRQDALRGRKPTAPVVHDGFIVVGDFDGYIHWFDAESGKQVGRVRILDPNEQFPIQEVSGTPNPYPDRRPVIAAPTPTQELLYALDARGTLNAYRTARLDQPDTPAEPVAAEEKKKPWWMPPWW